MKTLDITEEEAIELIAEDEEIDKMTMKQVDNDLTADQKQIVKKMKNAGTRKVSAVDAYGKKRTRNRTPDPVKRYIMQELLKAVRGLDKAQAVELSNIEREINFQISGRKFKLVVSATREPKGAK